jgi:hypothetical protein
MFPALMRIFCRRKPVRRGGSRACLISSGTNLFRRTQVPDLRVPKLCARGAVQQRERLAHLIWTEGALKL